MRFDECAFHKSKVHFHLYWLFELVLRDEIGQSHLVNVFYPVI